MWTHGYSLFSLGYNPVLVLLVLSLKSFQRELLQVSSRFFQHSTDPVISLLLYFLPFQHKVLRLILDFPCPCPAINQFPVPFIQERLLETKIWVLGMVIATGVSQQTELGYKIYINLCIHTHIYSLLHALICMYFLKSWLVDFICMLWLKK